MQNYFILFFTNTTLQTTVVSETLVNSGVDPKDPSLSKNISNIFEEFTESGNAYEPFSDAIELLESLRKV